MRTTLLTASLLAALPAIAAEPAAPFAALDYLVGHCWRAEFKNGQRDIQCYERMYDGKFVKSTHIVVGGEGPAYQGMTVFSWDGATQRLRFHYFTSTGAVSEGHFTEGADGIVIPERHVGQDGKVTELESRYERDGEFGYRVVTRERTAEGWIERMNLHYRRSDAPGQQQDVVALSLPDGEWRLVWSTHRDDNWEIYRQEPDGAQTSLSRRDSNEWAWTARGDMLHLVSSQRDDDEPKGWRAHAMRGDGSGFRRLSDEVVGEGHVDCQPDGQRCVAEVKEDGRRRLAYFDATGKRIGLIDTGSGNATYPQYSPDGSKLVYRSDRGGHWDLWLADADGAHALQLTDDPGNDDITSDFSGEGPAQFSPDGRRIVWPRTFGQGNKKDIWVMAIDGGPATNLTADSTADESYPAFSPDGRSIAFASDRDGNDEIYVMDADGRNVRRITHHPDYDSAPLWVRLPKEAAP